MDQAYHEPNRVYSNDEDANENRKEDEDNEEIADSGESEDGEESEDEQVEDIRKKFDDAMHAVDDIIMRGANEREIDIFISQHRELVECDSNIYPSPNSSFLNSVIELLSSDAHRKSASDVRPLVERLVHLHPSLLSIANREGQHPLYRAIYLYPDTGNLVECMLNACSDKDAIRSTLEQTCGEDKSLKTCLTLAFERDLEPEVLQNLIRHASVKALNLRDGRGRTPLHRAVDYSQCTDERVKVIKLLLRQDAQIIHEMNTERKSQPIATFLDCKYRRSEDGIEYSVYTEHGRTAKAYQRKQFEAKKQRERTSMKHGALANRETDPKRRAAEERDHRRPHSGRDRQVPELEALDDKEIERRKLRKEEREEWEQKAKVGNRQTQDQAPGRDQLRPRSGRELHEHQGNVSSDFHMVRIDTVGIDPSPNSRMKRAPKQNVSAVEPKEKERDKRPLTKKTPKKPSSRTLSKNSAMILEMLKLHYMRTRSIEMVSTFLYGKGIDVEICFDYTNLPSKVADNDFEQRFGKDCSSGIRFDEVLMYVRFSNVQIHRTGRLKSGPRAAGREDMEFFFGWLHAKGVRRILKVQVEDSGDISHSDESIQKALEKMRVEHLDWRKPDLDPRTILQVGRKSGDSASLQPTQSSQSVASADATSELREVTLRWSGSNAVLRAWSEPEGLPQLPELEVINLSVPAEADLLDSKEWVERSLKEFEKRLNDHAKARLPGNPISQSELSNVEISSWSNTKDNTTSSLRNIIVKTKYGDKGIVTPVFPSGIPQPAEKTVHDWLTCMERFAGNMRTFWNQTIELSRELSREGHRNGQAIENMKKDVIVALIDDGVNFLDPTFNGRVVDGKAFDFQGDSFGPHYSSCRGHGTEMARMILKVCPMASIYSIRLKTHIHHDEGHATIDAISAASAIEAALEKNATIISMAWTIRKPDDPTVKEKLDAVLKRACDQKVPMFCSSSDSISHTDPYPSAYNRKQMFRIGAAKDDGSGYGLAGHGNDFLLPGVKVNTSAGITVGFNAADKTPSLGESTGSSIATALAAGLSAMLIYCFKACALANIDRMEFVEDAENITKHGDLEAALEKIGLSENNFIEVWNMFDPASKEMETETHQAGAKQRCITTLCSKLIERKFKKS